MPNWTDYTKKQQPSDNDLMMIEDVDANVNKRLEFSGLADWIVKKLKKNNVISGALKFKGSSAYASLPTNPEQNDYYYSPDGNGTDGAGYYAWNGTAWIFIGNNDKGVDSTFTVEGAAADSKAVGDKFAKVDRETASLKEDIDNIIQNVSNDSMWTIGGFSASTGIANTADNRMHTDFLTDSVISVKANEDYDVLIYGWDDKNNYLGYLVNDEWVSTGAIWKKEYNLKYLRQKFPNTKFKLSGRKSSNGTIDKALFYKGVIVKSYAIINQINKIFDNGEYQTSIYLSSLCSSQGQLPLKLILNCSDIDISDNFQGLTIKDDYIFTISHDSEGNGHVRLFSKQGELIRDIKTSTMVLHGISVVNLPDDRNILIASNDNNVRRFYTYDYKSNIWSAPTVFPAIDGYTAIGIGYIDSSRYLLVYSDLAVGNATIKSVVYNIKDGTTQERSTTRTKNTYVQDVTVDACVVYAQCNDGAGATTSGRLIMYGWTTGDIFGTIYHVNVGEVEGVAIEKESDGTYIYFIDNTRKLLYKAKMQ